MSVFFAKYTRMGGASKISPLCYRVSTGKHLAPYLTLTSFDQNQELVHFGKLTHHTNGRIPEMRMPVFSGIFMFSDVRIRRENLGCGVYLALFTLHSF